MRLVLEEIEVQKEKLELAGAENRALRSHLEQVKGTDFYIEPPHPVPSQNFTSDIPVDNPTTNFPPNPTIPTARNPFPPLPLLKKHLEIIEKGEYLDFDKIKPKNLDQWKKEDQGEGFEVALTS